MSALDDRSIADDSTLFRLVNPEHDVDWDDDEKCWIVKSSAFQNTGGTDRMSVVLGVVLREAGRPPEDARRSKPDWYVVALPTGQARREGQAVVRDPVPEEPAHGNLVGYKGKSQRRRLKAISSWVVAPADPV